MYVNQRNRQYIYYIIQHVYIPHTYVQRGTDNNYDSIVIIYKIYIVLTYILITMLVPYTTTKIQEYFTPALY